MTHSPDGDRRLDAELRRALEPDPRAVARLVERALRPRPRPPVPRWPLAAAAVAIAAMVFVALPWRAPAPRPPAATQSPLEPVAAGRLAITNHDDVVTVARGGEVLIVLLPETHR